MATYKGLNLQQEFANANARLAPVLNKTDLIFSHNYNLFLKPEVLQRTGSFKIRGAFNKIAKLQESGKAIKAVVAASAGNHAAGVAFAAKQMHIPAIIVMPNITPNLKIQNTRSLGAKVILEGDNYDQSYKFAVKYAQDNNYDFVHPFDDIDVIIGQGTIGYEIINNLPDVKEIYVSVGGGGLVAGICLAAKCLNSKVKIIGVEPEFAASLKLSLSNNKNTPLKNVNTIAEGVAVKKTGRITFDIARKYLDKVITVSEKDIMETVLGVIESEKLIVETAGAVGLAGAIKNKARKNSVSVLSGGNIDLVTIASLVNRGMIGRGRITSFSVELPDRPGGLLKIASILSKLGANVIELDHDQFKAVDRYSNKVVLEVTVETNGHEHITKIFEKLSLEGFDVNKLY